MKKTIAKIIFALLISLPLTMLAQTPIDKLYEKYNGKPGFTSINLSPKLFNIFQGMETDGDDEAADMKKAISQISTMKILSYEPEEGTETINFKEEVENALNLDGYEEMMVINSSDGGVQFLIKEEDGKIIEFLMLAGDNNDFTVMSFLGNMDIETLQSVSRTMGRHQMGVDIDIDSDEDQDEEQE
jgi:Domain of unknown function (DUF4252)